MAKGITVKQAVANLKYLNGLPAHDQQRPSVKSAIKMYRSVILSSAQKSTERARKSVGAPKGSFVVTIKDSNGTRAEAYKGKKVYKK